MLDRIERIAEMPITEWHGARIKISIEVPQLNNSLSTQRYIDSRELETLKFLYPPKRLELLINKNPALARFEFMKWEKQKKGAEKLLSAISDQIAWQIGNGIKEGLSKEE